MREVDFDSGGSPGPRKAALIQPRQEVKIGFLKSNIAANKWKEDLALLMADISTMDTRRGHGTMSNATSSCGKGENQRRQV
jgi:hypothetical protein